MDKQPKSSNQGGDCPSGDPPFDETEPVSGTADKPATEEKLAEVERKMSGFERSTLRLAIANLIVVAATGGFIALQWHEMKTGSVDTHNLAEAAGYQAQGIENMSNAARDQAVSLHNQVDRTEELAARMKDQAVNTGEVASAASNQAAQLKGQLEVMRFQQRPWIIPSIEVNSQRVLGTPSVPMLFVDTSLNLKDVGATPAKRVFARSKTVTGVSEMKEAWKNSSAICVDAEKASNDPAQLSPVIFPGSIGIDMPNGISFSGEAPVKAIGMAGSKWYIVCVAYQEATQEENSHHTKILFHAVEERIPGLIQAPDMKSVQYKPIASFEIVDAEAN